MLGNEQKVKKNKLGQELTPWGSPRMLSVHNVGQVSPFPCPDVGVERTRRCGLLRARSLTNYKLLNCPAAAPRAAPRVFNQNGDFGIILP